MEVCWKLSSRKWSEEFFVKFVLRFLFQKFCALSEKFHQLLIFILKRILKLKKMKKRIKFFGVLTMKNLQFWYNFPLLSNWVPKAFPEEFMYKIFFKKIFRNSLEESSGTKSFPSRFFSFFPKI